VVLSSNKLHIGHMLVHLCDVYGLHFTFLFVKDYFFIPACIIGVVDG